MKILDSEFRKELYKNLVEAGYEKSEAQKIVGVKYFNALKEKVVSDISAKVSEIDGKQFNPLAEDFVATFNSDIAELNKMKEFIG